MFLQNSHDKVKLWKAHSHMLLMLNNFFVFKIFWNTFEKCFTTFNETSRLGASMVKLRNSPSFRCFYFHSYKSCEEFRRNFHQCSRSSSNNVKFTLENLDCERWKILFNTRACFGKRKGSRKSDERWKIFDFVFRFLRSIQSRWSF